MVMQPSFNETAQIPFAAQIFLQMESFLTIFLNGLVWLLFFKYPNLRNRSNVFLVSLSASHFFLGLLGAPFYVWAKEGHVLDLISTGVMYYLLCTSILNMYLVTYERYLSILKPLRYNHRMSKSFIVNSICFAWTSPIIFTTVDMVFRTVMVLHLFSPGYLAYRWIQALTFLATSVLLTAVNVAVFRVARRQYQAIQALQHIGNALRGVVGGPSAWREKRTTFFFVYIVATFFVFWLPRIASYVYGLIVHKMIDRTLPDIVTLCIALLNPIFDPLIYLFFKSDFKRALKHTLQLRHQIHPVVVTSRHFVQDNQARLR